MKQLALKCFLFQLRKATCHSHLKIIMTFEWNCGVSWYYNHCSLLGGCVCFSKKKMIIVSHCLKKCVVCSITCLTLP